MGASWMNTVLGVIVVIGDVGAFISKFVSENATPVTFADWLVFGMGLATGVGLIVSKQWNVSNAPEPTKATAVTTSEEATAKPV